MANTFVRSYRRTTESGDPLDSTLTIEVKGFGWVRKYETADLMTLGEIVRKQEELEDELRLWVALAGAVPQ